jgi:predicted RNase H-like HicB family nuclease
MKTKKSLKTLYGTYEVVLTPNKPEKGYTVTVPALKGLVTFGNTISDSFVQAKEAIELHCQAMIEEGTARVTPFARARTTM